MSQFKKLTKSYEIVRAAFIKLYELMRLLLKASTESGENDNSRRTG